MDVTKGLSLANKGELIPFEFQLLVVLALLVITVAFVFVGKFRCAVNTFVLLLIAIFSPYLVELVLVILPWWAAIILGGVTVLLIIRSFVALFFGKSVADQMLGQFLGTLLQHIFLTPFILLGSILKRAYGLEIIKKTMSHLNSPLPTLNIAKKNATTMIEDKTPRSSTRKRHLHTLGKRLITKIGSWLRMP